MLFQQQELRKEEATLIEGFTPDGYYAACIGGTWITFISYEEYLEYLTDD